MLKEYSEDKDKLSSYVPWICLVDKGVILNKNGTLQKTLRYRGYDLDSSTVYELKNINARLNEVIKRLGEGWSFHIEARRKKYSNYAEIKSDILAIKIIEKERKENFSKGVYFESEYYLTLVQLIPSDSSKKVGEIFLEYSEKRKILDKSLENFNKEFKQMLNLLKEVFLEVEELNDEETYTYLHSCVSIKTDSISIPEIPYAISNYLCDCDLVGGLKTKLGGKELRCISIQGFPNYTVPGFFDILNRLDIEYRWITRFLMLSKLEAISKLERKYKNIFSGRLSLFQRVMAELTGEQEENPRKLNEDALIKADEVKTQIALTNGEYVGQGFYTCTIIVMGDTEEEVDIKVEKISKSINNMGFTTIEETINSVEAFLGSIAGNITNNIRMPILNTITLSHLLPTSSIWSGDNWNKHLNMPTLIYTKTKGCTPFRFNLHIESVGHTCITGPTGAGKSVLLGLIASSFMKYPSARVYFFDKDASSRVLTYSMGGKFHDLGEDELTFQPLKGIGKIQENIDKNLGEIKNRKDSINDELALIEAIKIESDRAEKEKEWAYNWILEILNQENLELTPIQKEKIWAVLDNLALAPIEFRTISSFYTSINDREIKEALLAYKIGGALGKYFDSDNDSLNFERWQVFEMNQVMANKKAIIPLLSYIFRRIENSLDGSPTIIVLDECWMFFDNPIFSTKIREWLKVLRKKNCSVIFATQELGDILNSPIFTTVLDACHTKIFLPNPNAFAENYIPIYQKFGLNRTEIETISKAIPRKEYYYKSMKGSRLFDLDLKENAIKLVSKTDIVSQKEAKRIKELVNSADEFTREWLRIG
ncbi:MAG: ATPase [Fusobacterium gastrosuis]|uniref:VirB4 family type IV secretion/conjugal transfer ATPase n=2 Tax=Fusobacteriaceae TaxID=203492 RepID=UPI0025C00497|nr:ATPase [Fusobacterium sp.]MCI7224331.1 ATPase [Fusobacterium sp.]MDY5794719.1 ATPase [Fusobacterium gastrosuis]